MFVLNESTPYKEICSIREIVDTEQKKIAKQLASEGVLIEEGWTYDVCFQIVFRLPQQVFDYAFYLVSICETKDVGVTYHMAYKKAVTDCYFHRYINDIVAEK